MPDLKASHLPEQTKGEGSISHLGQRHLFSLAVENPLAPIIKVVYRKYCTWGNPNLLS